MHTSCQYNAVGFGEHSGPWAECWGHKSEEHALDKTDAPEVPAVSVHPEAPPLPVKVLEPPFPHL